MDSNNPDSQDIGSKVVADIKKDFVAMGAHRVHGWYTWAVVGVGIGAIIAVTYVANLNGKFYASHAQDAGGVAQICPGLCKEKIYASGESKGAPFSMTDEEISALEPFHTDGGYHGPISNEFWSKTEEITLAMARQHELEDKLEALRVEAKEKCDTNLVTIRDAAMASCQSFNDQCEVSKCTAVPKPPKLDDTACSEATCAVVDTLAVVRTLFPNKKNLACISETRPAGKVTSACGVVTPSGVGPTPRGPNWGGGTAGGPQTGGFAPPGPSTPGPANIAGEGCVFNSGAQTNTMKHLYKDGPNQVPPYSQYLAFCGIYEGKCNDNTLVCNYSKCTCEKATTGAINANGSGEEDGLTPATPGTGGDATGVR